ncbi:ABC-F family ATP-binding cassette domain-containing protein [Spiroplasma endosymbiont of Othius punctulatus]|uniref:ABC-F family ATP-binding cassette domain-containing protein n=1 Tax=Spiroplasma endosymbiont of Othius punctulatus TaxID=3066289 RepID=UPI0030D54C8D
MGLIYVKDMTHANGGKKLYDNVTFRFNRKEHIALIGANGSGKTTLFNIIIGKITPDKGGVELHPRVKIGYLDQHLEVEPNITVDSYLKEAFKELYFLEDKMNKIYEGMAIEYKEDDLVKALDIQNELDIKGFDQVEKKIGNLINGLGIGIDKLPLKLESMSGGQKAKIMLAKLLVSDFDFFMLDEPTNFLDITQVEWLAKYLAAFEKPFVLISHDVDFINKTCGIIYAIENLQVNRYVGNYDKYMEESEMRRVQYDNAFSSQQKQIDKLKTYVAKNAARASTAKSAQSRVKQLEKMDVMGKRQDLVKPNFKFAYKKPGSSIILDFKNLALGYDRALIKDLNFVIREGEKHIVSGKNGVGKTTLLNTISGEIKPFDGEVKYAPHLTFQYFKQIEKFDDVTPIQYLLRKFPNITEQEARVKLSQFGIKTGLMFQSIQTLSGGEQAKVRLSALSLEKCALLLLDEPTNHIDVLAKESLLEAIQSFEGTVLLTTHDINFSTNWADSVIDFENKK